MTTATIQRTKKKIQQGQIASLTQEELNELVEMISIFLEQEEEKQFEKKLDNLPKVQATKEEEEAIAQGRKDIKDGNYKTLRADDPRTVSEFLGIK